MPLLQRHVSVRAVRFPVSWPKPPVRGGTPLLGFIKDRPSTDKSAVRPLPGCPKAALRREDANPRACSALAVPPGSDGFLHAGPAGLLHPATGHGVRHISSSLLRALSEDRVLCRAPSQMAHTPFEAFPFATAAPRHRGRCPLAVELPFRSAAPPCKHGGFTSLPRCPQPQGLAPSQSPLLHSVLPPRSARCSLGLGSTGVMKGAPSSARPKARGAPGARCRSEDRG
jgi:hypothetical protein